MVDSARPSDRSGSIGPAVAGSWYRADRAGLERQVDDLLAGAGTAKPAHGTPPLALIAPHAGFMYSGAVAARAFRDLVGHQIRRVILIGPSHYASFRGICVPWAATYRTPLGRVAIDMDAVDALASRPAVRQDDGPFLPEHCLEAEVPFLQRVLPPGWTVVPLLVGAEPPARAQADIAEALTGLCVPGSLLVVSSDFTHYGPRFGFVPFRDRVPERLHALDRGAIDRILAIDREGFRRYVAETGATICGRGAIDLLLATLDPGCPAELVAYDTSGAMTGDWDHSVSYAGLRFHARGTNA